METIIKVLALLASVLPLVGCNAQSKPPNETSSQHTLDFLGTDDSPVTDRVPLLVSMDIGQTWIDVSEGLPREMQVSFMQLLGDEIVIATDNMGLFISKDNHTHWDRVGHDLPGQKINALYIANQNIYVGVFGRGIFSSADAGQTWWPISYDLPHQNVQSICQFGKDLLAGTDAGIFILAENTTSWMPTNITVQVVSIDAYDGILVAGTSRGTAISRDKGESWTWIRTEGAVHYTRNIGSTIVELAINGDLVFSEDWGASWQSVNYAPREGSYVYEIAQIGQYLIMSNNYGIHRSTDHGKNWQLVYPTESMGFFDFLVVDGKVYGGTRVWDEYRKRNK